MQGSPQQHAHVHSEIVDFKDLRLCKQQDKHADELGHRDATEYLRREEGRRGEGRGEEEWGGEERGAYDICC